MAMRTVAIEFAASEGTKSAGLALVQQVERGGRWRRALQLLGWGALLILGVALMPYGTLAVAPVVLLGGFLLFRRKRPPQTLLTGGGGPCPSCRARVDLQHQPVAWPVDMSCPHCRVTLSVQPLAAKRMAAAA